MNWNKIRRLSFHCHTELSFVYLRIQALLDKRVASSGDGHDVFSIGRAMAG